MNDVKRARMISAALFLALAAAMLGRFGIGLRGFHGGL